VNNMPAEDTTDTPVSDFAADIAAIGRIDAVPRILDIVSRATGMGFAAVARVTTDRWICCASLDNIGFGLQPGGELKVETTICNEIRDNRAPVVIDHVADDAVFRGHHTPAMYGFQSYISVPIILTDGRFFGTLCAIDPRPARLNNPETIGTFKLFAELIATHLDALDRLDASEARLLDERKASELREQFIAVLGHDLRNPLAAIASGVRLMTKAKSIEDTVKLAGLMQQTVNRMAKLIDNVLDFARGRLGGGFILQRRPEHLEGVLDQVATEMRSSHTDRDIETRFDIKQTINCDPQRIAQLFSNLLGNALDHGSKETPIVARANAENGVFELSITNAGETIPPETVAKLFHPFYRGTTKGPLQGLGLGLFIASEIARAHDGTLDVVSADGETRFTFRMPIG
jgi:signal transduction histidine kinase